VGYGYRAYLLKKSNVEEDVEENDEDSQATHDELFDDHETPEMLKLDPTNSKVFFFSFFLF